MRLVRLKDTRRFRLEKLEEQVNCCLYGKVVGWK